MRYEISTGSEFFECEDFNQAKRLANIISKAEDVLVWVWDNTHTQERASYRAQHGAEYPYE